jgi:uncharacterized damage-inducible protein DinB
MTATLFRALLTYNQWADGDVLDGLYAGELNQSPDALHNVLRILNHIYTVYRIFQANLQKLKHDFTDTNTPETPTIEKLKEDFRIISNWYIGYVASLDDCALQEKISFAFVDGKLGQMSREEMLTHVLLHSAGHRGAISQILNQNGIEPPKNLLTSFIHRRK